MGDCLHPVHCLFAADGAGVEDGQEHGSEGAECVVDGGVVAANVRDQNRILCCNLGGGVHGDACACDGREQEIYLGGGDEVAGVDEVDQGADLQLVSAQHGGVRRRARGARVIAGCDAHELPTQDECQEHSQPGVAAHVPRVLNCRAFIHACFDHAAAGVRKKSVQWDNHGALQVTLPQRHLSQTIRAAVAVECTRHVHATVSASGG